MLQPTDAFKKRCSGGADKKAHSLTAEFYMTPPDLSNWDKLSDYCRRSIVRLEANGMVHNLTEDFLVKWIKGNGWEKTMNAIIQAKNEDCINILYIENLLYPVKPIQKTSHRVYSESDFSDVIKSPTLVPYKFTREENEEWWGRLSEKEKQRYIDYFAWKHIMFDSLLKAGRVKPLQEAFIKDSWFLALMDLLERR